MQVIAIRLPRPDGQVSAEDWRLRLAAQLPPGLGIVALHPAPRGFHPQWSALGKTYRYRLAISGAPRTGTLGDVQDAACAWAPATDARLQGAPFPEGLTTDRLEALLREVEGTRDFSAFHPASSPKRPRRVRRCAVASSEGEVLEVTIEGDGFARHQVRYLVGSAVATAMGVLSERQWREALAQATPIPGIRAPADGLTLWEVHYPSAIDPFSGAERAAAAGVPSGPPFGRREGISAYADGV